MRSECFPSRRLALALVLSVLGVAAPAKAQEPSGEPAAPRPSPVGFEPRFIEPEEYRDGQVLLYDWPALTRLVRWTAPVAQAVAEPDSALSPELLEEFRSRVAELAAADPPAFLAERADSVRAVLEAVETSLDQAEAMLAASLPAEIAMPTGEERPNRPDRERTYATGPTAVRVPAGVGVGDADSLPGARIEGPLGRPNHLDLITDALDRLDALVHMVRKLGESASEAPASEAPTPSPDTVPPRPGP